MKLLAIFTVVTNVFTTPFAVASQNATVHGNITWEGSDGVRHSARDVVVQILDFRTRVPLAPATHTDESGAYTANIAVGPNPRQISVRALAETNSAFVHSTRTTERWALESPSAVTVSPGGSVGVDLSGKGETENNEALSIADAIHAVQPYVRTIAGKVLTAIDVVFPTDHTTSEFTGTQLHLIRGDRWDWDVILHEYGHYVSSEFDLDDNPGGKHNLGVNLGTIMAKGPALRLAWGEGWPTYFSLSGQIHQHMTDLRIPNAGDTRYQDTDDATIDYDLASQDGDPSIGEDYEVSTSRVLFDFEDGVKANDCLSIGPAPIFDSLIVAHAHTLGQGLQRILHNATHADSVCAGAILATHRISPDPLSPSDQIKIPPTAPTFRWRASETAFPNDRFTVRFFDADGRLLHESPEIAVEQYTPPAAAWSAIRATTRFPIAWIVYGRNPSSPATGPYPGSVRKLIAP